MSKNKNWWEYKSSSKEREILDALDPIYTDPESGEEVGTPFHQRAVELRNVSTKKLLAADEKLLKKITSGELYITPKDLKFVSNKILRNVMQKFEREDTKNASTWKGWERTYINPYAITHDQRPFNWLNRSAKKRLEDHFEDWQRHYGKTIMSGGNTPHMYRSIRKAQKIGDTLYPTKGMSTGSKAKKKTKKKQSGNDLVASLYKGFK